MIIIEEKNKKDSIWNAAITVKEKTKQYTCFCDICRKKQLAAFCRVYHTVDRGCIFTKVTEEGHKLITDHIFVCCSCRYVVSYKWLGCNCSATKKPRYEVRVCLTNK